MGSTENYSVPEEAAQLLLNGIVGNPLHKGLPEIAVELCRNVKFVGNSKPSIPINWRFAESISALKGFEAVMLNNLLGRKYGIKPVEVTINTDHASLFFMSPLVAQIIKDGKPVPFNLFDTKALFPDADLHRSQASPQRKLATNIYKTRDGRFYHCHGSMNPEPTLTALGLSIEGEADDTDDDAIRRIQSAVLQYDAAELDITMNQEYRQAGTIAYFSEEFFATEQGKNTVGLYELIRNTTSAQPPSWWPGNPSLPSTSKRPLAGLKVVDLTRVIAGPSLTRNLAELGASVMRVVSPHVTDLSAVHQDLNWGKWNTFLHLKDEADKEKLKALLLEADVVVDDYRPGVMEKLGFGRQAVFDLVKYQERGIIHVRENCYGWHGPWSHRTGWQQSSDACCGVSLEYGRAMGNNEPVTPVFPNSDYCTGVAGTSGVLDALVKRGENGGSYGVDVALNYYSQWLVRSCGTYPKQVWDEVYTRHGSPVFRHYHAMPHLLPSVMKLLYQHDSAVLFQPSFFEQRESKNLKTTFVVVKPVLQFSGKEVELGYNVGTRPNGVDQPYWPRDLTVEIVKEEI